MGQLTAATEGSTYEITVALTDETGAAISPTTLVWSLRDDIGTIINGRDSVVATASTSISIVLGADDLVYGEDSTKRFITYEGTYTSSLGTGLPIVAEDWFEIENVTGLGWETGEDVDIEQLPGYRNIKLVQGDDLDLQIRVPFDILGYTWAVTAFRHNSGAVTIPVSASATSSTLGVIQISFQASITSAFEVAEHSWEVKYVNTSLKTRTLIAGALGVL